MTDSDDESRRLHEESSRRLEAVKHEYRVAGSLAAMIAAVSILETFRGQTFKDFETSSNESHRVALDSFSDYIGELSANIQAQIGQLIGATQVAG